MPFNLERGKLLGSGTTRGGQGMIRVVVVVLVVGFIVDATFY